MGTSNTPTTGLDSSVASAQKTGRATQSAIPAPVDIFEDKDSLILVADMPGVSKDRLEVRVDGNTLLLEGSVRIELSQKAEALYADVRATAYQRSFVLSSELDTEKIQANLADGVVTVRIPKRTALRPRKIEVQGS
jgi:HSP20 family protein